VAIRTPKVTNVARSKGDLVARNLALLVIMRIRMVGGIAC